MCFRILFYKEFILKMLCDHVCYITFAEGKTTLLRL